MPPVILPGAEYALSPHRPDGGDPRRPDLPPRAVIHTTETDPGTLDAVARNLQWPYHLLVEPATRRVRQLIRSLDRTAYSLKAGRGFETNHAGAFCVQVSLVMRARNVPDLRRAELEWLTEAVLGPVAELAGVPNVWPRFYGPGEGIVLASMSSPIRFPVDGWYSFSGWCGHQHVPGQDHWDPGRLDYQTIRNILEEGSVVPFDQWMREYNRAEPDAENGIVEMVQRFLKERRLYGGDLDGLKGPRTDLAWAGWEQSISAPNVNKWAGAVSWGRLIGDMMEPCPAHGGCEDERARIVELEAEVVGLTSERDDAIVERDAAAEVAQARGAAIESASKTLTESP